MNFNKTLAETTYEDVLPNNNDIVLGHAHGRHFIYDPEKDMPFALDMKTHEACFMDTRKFLEMVQPMFDMLGAERAVKVLQEEGDERMRDLLTATGIFLKMKNATTWPGREKALLWHRQLWDFTAEQDGLMYYNSMLGIMAIPVIYEGCDTFEPVFEYYAVTDKLLAEAQELPEYNTAVAAIKAAGVEYIINNPNKEAA